MPCPISGPALDRTDDGVIIPTVKKRRVPDVYRKSRFRLSKLELPSNVRKVLKIPTVV